MSRHDRAALLTMLVLCASVAGCSSDTPVSPELDPDAPEVETPRTGPNGGQRLRGDPSQGAWSVFERLAPTAAHAANIVDGWILSRMTVVLHPDATVEQVNDALDEHGAGIVSMVPGDLLMSLAVPPAADEAAARAAAASIAATDAFVFAFPARASRPPTLGDRHPGGGAGGPAPVPTQSVYTAGHLSAIRMPAAWNASGLATANANKVTVLVPDWYHSGETHPDIAAQSFLAGGGSTDPGENHGFHVSGIVGADFDEDGATGTSPAPEALLDIRALHVNGLSEAELSHAIATAFPASGRFVLNTSIGYANEDPITTEDRVARAFHALSWRILTHGDYGRYVHGTASGNEGEHADLRGDARYGSKFSIAALWTDIRDMVPFDSLSADEVAGFHVAWDAMLAANPAAATQPDNTLVVGASNLAGEEVSFSNRGADVRVVGEEVLSSCIAEEPDYLEEFTCDGEVASYDGTSMATPQVVGLAAYLWSLDPTLTPSEIVIALRTAYEHGEVEGLVDAYGAALSLDSSIDDAPVRGAILDVAGGTLEAAPNGVFDEVDVEAFLAFFAFYEAERAGGNDGADESRYDLSGDGFTGGGFATGMDLSVDGGPPLGTSTQTIEGHDVSFDETFVTDFEVLCYYAYSPLYVGNMERRTELLADCNPEEEEEEEEPPVDIGFSSIVGYKELVAVARGDDTALDVDSAVVGGGDGSGSVYAESSGFLPAVGGSYSSSAALSVSWTTSAATSEAVITTTGSTTLTARQTNDSGYGGASARGIVEAILGQAFSVSQPVTVTWTFDFTIEEGNGLPEASFTILDEVGNAVAWTEEPDPVSSLILVADLAPGTYGLRFDLNARAGDGSTTPRSDRGSWISVARITPQP